MSTRGEIGKMKLEEKLASLRKRQGLSQQDLADALEVSRQTVSKWETGVTAPSTENLLRIGKLLDTSIDLLADDGMQLESALAVTGEATTPEGGYTVIPGRWNLKRLVVVLCILAFLSGALVGGCLLSLKGEVDTAIPMEELEGEEVDISQMNDFSLEPLQP